VVAGTPLAREEVAARPARASARRKYGHRRGRRHVGTVAAPLATLHRRPHYTSGVAQPLRTPAEDEAPPIDPVAVHRAYRWEKARRRVRDERRRASKRANRRFWFIMLALLVACVVLAVTVWNEVERLFGL
jgi:hypothetical protein